ncbi:MAG: hypothetical protein OQK56_04050 [Ignavibacteriaceae bacterium]|nr:hypothetical protein [Ignavibacteriaceae bacterium]
MINLLNKLLVVLILFYFTGCLNYVQEVTLYPDGSGKMRIEYCMKLPDEESKAVAENIGIFNPDSIRSEFSSVHINLVNINVFSDTTDSTTHAIINFTFDRIDSLNRTKAFNVVNFSFQEGASGVINFTQFIPPIATGFGIDATQYNVSYIYTFSGKILVHNAHKVNKRTLSWNYSLADIGGGKSISVTFRPYKLKETPNWIYMLAGTVLALVIFFLLRKQKV